MSEGMLFHRYQAGILKIGGAAVAVMQQYAQTDPTMLEAGGVLLGRYIVDTPNIVIDRITIPSLHDRRSRFRFFRSKQPHQEIIDQTWKESAHTSTYLGEWHTHPETMPTPSIIDTFDWCRKLMFDQFSENIFFIIVGTVELCVWEGQFHRPCLRQLPRIN
jgi:integrative and conjugative element protein (TIGR02256 family)